MSENLIGFGKMAERHWRENRPRLWKALKAKGVLHAHLKEAGDLADEYMEKAQQQNVPYEAAKEIALAEFILLPDIEADEVTPTDESIIA